MKSHTSKLLLTVMMFLVNVAIFAQPNPDPIPGDPNPTDAPLDSSVWALLAVGSFFVAYKFYAKRQIIK